MPDYAQSSCAIAGRWRRCSSVPLLREGEADRRDHGGCATRPAPFAPREIDVCCRPSPTRRSSRSRTCACSTRRRRRCERQTATTEVLKVISESPTDVQPVFDSIAERAAAAHRCAVRTGLSLRRRADPCRQLVRRRSARDFGPAAGRFRCRPDGPAICARAIRSGKVVNVADLLADPMPTIRAFMKESVRKAGFRSAMSVPMLHDQRVIGAINVEPCRARRVRRQGGRAAADLRRPGGDRDRERAPVQRDQGGAGAADRHRRGAAGDQQLGGRCDAGVRQDPRQLPAAFRERAARDLLVGDDDGMVHVGAMARLDAFEAADAHAADAR